MAMLYIATTINGRIALANADGVGLMKLGTNMKNVQDLILTRTGRTKTMEEQLYKFCWGNNSERAKMKGRVCRVLARGKMNSCMIEFIDGEEPKSACVSRNALRKLSEDKDNG